jgi:hypothetical protein
VNRILQVVLSGTNRLSPVLDRAARDVDDFTARQEKANQRIRDSSQRTTDQQKRDTDERIKDQDRQSKATEDAARRVQTIRQTLSEFGRDKIKVGADTVEARMQLERLQSQLDEVATKTPTARVKAETAAAQMQIRAIQSAVDRLDGQTANVNVNVDDHGSTQGAAAGVGGLLNAALALSPALIPIGAAAAAGIGVIGPLAATGAAGIGVLALGISGVAGAVKLLMQQEQAQTVAANKGAVSQASSAQAIKGAQESLANTRADAADAAVRAAERVSNAQRDEARAVTQAVVDVQDAIRTEQQAERDLTREQRDQRQAQLDLTQARKDAQQQLEDLAAQVTDNALAQRQSVLDVAAAQKDLNAVLGDPNSTGTQREQARITYEEQISRQRQLATEGRRLADQQADADAKGIEGAQGVVQAQQRVADVNESVATATQRVGDAAAAVDKARADGAEKVAAAQQAVVDAVREQATQQRQAAFSIAQAQHAVSAAMSSAGTAGAAAFSAVDAQLAQVGPSTLAFAGYVKDRLKPAFDGLQETAAHGMLPGVQQAIETLMPYLPQVDSFVGRIAGKLGDLSVQGARSLGSPTWQRFFQMIDRDAVPIMDDFFNTLFNVAEGFAGIVTAFAPMSREVGGGIRGMSEDFRDWGDSLGRSSGFHEFTDYVKANWPAIRDTVENVATVVEHLVEAGAPIGGAYLSGFKVLTEVLADLPVGVVEALLVAFLAYRTVSGVAGIINGISSSIKGIGTAVDTIKGVPGKIGDVASKLGGLKGAAGNLIDTLGGPWGIAFAGATAVLAGISAEMQQADDNTRKWADGLVKGGDAATQAMKEYQDQRSHEPTGWLADLDEWTGLHGSIDDAKKSAEDYFRSLDPVAEAQARAAHWQAELSSRLKEYGDGSPQVEAAQRRYAYWTQVGTDRQGELDGAMGRVNDRTATQKQRLEDLNGTYRDSSQAESDYYAAVDAAATALQGLSGQVVDNKGQLDLQTEAGRGARDALYEMRDKSDALIESMITQGVATQDVQAKDAQLRQSFYNTALQMTGSKDAALLLTNQIYGIPQDRHTTITLDSEAADKHLQAIKAGLDGLDGRTVTVTVNSNGTVALMGSSSQRSGPGVIVGYAEGGYTGPGGKHTPAGLVHAGEVVWSQEDIAAHGGVSRVERMRKLRSYANGGVVINIDSRQLEETISAVGQAMLTGGGAGRLGSTWGSIWDAVHPAIPEARQNSTYRPGDPGYHGKNKAIDFGFGGGAGGNGSAGLASIARFLFRGYGRTLAELIYDGIGDDTPDMKNGNPHTYDPATQAAHHNHVHAAVRDGGGLLPAGMSLVYNGTGDSENAAVFTAAQWDALQTLANRAAAIPAPGAGVDYAQLNGALQPQFDVVAVVRIGERDITDIVNTNVDVKLRGTVRAARAAGKGRS